MDLEQGTSADRVLRLLSILQAGRTLSVTAAAAELDVANSTAHRLLTTLVRHDFAGQDQRRRYTASPGIGLDPIAIIDPHRLRELVSTSLSQILEATGETVHFEVLAGDTVRFISGLEGTQNVLRISLRTGLSMPAYISAGGRAMLAELPNAAVEERHRNGLPPWAAAKTTSLKTLKRHLAKVRRDGYAISLNETEVGVTSIGMALTDGVRPIGALAIAVPSARFDRTEVPELVSSLRKQARDLERLLLEEHKRMRRRVLES